MTDDEILISALKAYIHYYTIDENTKCICENTPADSGVFDATPAGNSGVVVFGTDSDMDYYNVNGTFERG